MAESAKSNEAIRVRYDWYQTEKCVVINVLQKNIDESKLVVNCQKTDLSVTLPNLDEPWKLRLAHQIDCSNYEKKLTPSKLEIKLPKIEGVHWTQLERVEKELPADAPKATAKNWEDVAKSEGVEDEDDPLNQLFKKIYSEGTDEVRKAMNKSFFESGGTVLSTNWNEVERDKVVVKPPEGMEFKKWE